MPVSPRCFPTCSGRTGVGPPADTSSPRSSRACISREFTVMAQGRTSPIISWLRALAREEHARCGGPGVGAVGMCFTGGIRPGDDGGRRGGGAGAQPTLAPLSRDQIPPPRRGTVAGGPPTGPTSAPKPGPASSACASPATSSPHPTGSPTCASCSATPSWASSWTRPRAIPTGTGRRPIRFSPKTSTTGREPRPAPPWTRSWRSSGSGWSDEPASRAVEGSRAAPSPCAAMTSSPLTFRQPGTSSGPHY